MCHQMLGMKENKSASPGGALRIAVPACGIQPSPCCPRLALPDPHALGNGQGGCCPSTGGSVSARTQLMIDATVTTSKSMLLELSITHTPPSDSACFVPAIINNLLFQQTGFFSLENHSPQFPSVPRVTCLTSVMLCAFAGGFSCCLCSLQVLVWPLQGVFLHLHLSC